MFSILEGTHVQSLGHIANTSCPKTQKAGFLGSVELLVSRKPVAQLHSQNLIPDGVAQANKLV